MVGCKVKIDLRALQGVKSLIYIRFRIGVEEICISSPKSSENLRLIISNFTGWILLINIYIRYTFLSFIRLWTTENRIKP